MTVLDMTNNALTGDFSVQTKFLGLAIEVS